MWLNLSVDNYPKMLRKLSFFFFFTTLLSVFYLRRNVAEINTIFSKWDTLFIEIVPDLENWHPILKTAPTMVLLSLLLAILSEAIKLHDKISNLFKIRQRFDVEYILKPYARAVQVQLTEDLINKLRSNRNELMGELFYAYASSSQSKTKIDPHIVIQALTNWSWVWVITETVCVLLVSCLILALYGEFLALIPLFIICAILLLISLYFFNECKRYAKTQVREIISEKKRKLTIRKRISAL